MKTHRISVSAAFLLLLSISSPQLAKANTLADYWGLTGLSFQHVVEQEVNDQLCFAGETLFQACIDGLNAAARMTNPPTQFIPISQLETRRAEYTRVYQQFGALAWVIVDSNFRLIPPATPLRERIQTVRNHRLAHIEAVRQLANHADIHSISFEQILTHLKFQFPLPGEEALVAGMIINAKLSYSLDPHSRIEPAVAFETRSGSSGGESYGGTGLILQVINEELVVVRIVPGGPAETARLRRGDVILSVNGRAVGSQPLDRIVSQLRGPVDTSVRVRYRRGERVRTVSITRRIVSLPNLTTEILTPREGHRVGVIHLSTFGYQQAADDVKTAVLSLMREGVEGLVLDLRDNGGGFVNEAGDIASLFLRSNQLVYSFHPLNGEAPSHYFTRGIPITDLPLVTVLNGGSASASELLAGALQDHRRSWIVGQRSFGKGTVQMGGRHPTLPNMMFWLTGARFHQPSGRTNQLTGILPDVELLPFPGATADDLVAYREEDAYTNPISAVGTPWVQPRPAEVAALTRSCRGFEARARQAFRAGTQPDYMLAQAADLALCAGQ